MAFFIGIIALAAAFFWLYKAKERDLADCVSILGLAKTTTPTESSGTTAEGLYYHQSLLLEGTLEGLRAELSVRTVRLNVARTSRRRGSQFTVLTLFPTSLSQPAFRLQPAGLMGWVEGLVQGVPECTSTGDAEFDAAYRLYTSDARGTLSVLGPDLRRDLLAFRQSVAGPLSNSLASQMASGYLLGSIEVEPGMILYSVSGSPTSKIANHLKLVAPLLVRLCGPAGLKESSAYLLR